MLLGGSGVEPLDCVTARGYMLAWFPLAGRFVDFDTSVTYIVCFTCKTKFEIFVNMLPTYIPYIVTSGPAVDWKCLQV